MPRLKRYPKHIACIESLWDDDLENRFSMGEVARTVASFHRLKSVHFTCNTEGELTHNLRLLKRRHGYGVLYFALHGYPGHVQLDSVDLTLSDLAERMGVGFKDWVVHLGTCQTVDVPKQQLRNFLAVTGVAMVLGYRESVDSIDAAASDLLLLDWLQEYRDIGAMWRRFRATYPDLIRETGMTALARR